MENIRTRTEATPIPKLPLTWEQPPQPPLEQAPQPVPEQPPQPVPEQPLQPAPAPLEDTVVPEENNASNAPLPEEDVEVAVLPAVESDEEEYAEEEPLPEEEEVEVMTLKSPDETSSAILQRTRSEQGVTISDVCRKIHITKTFIEDLENGNFARLPGEDQCLVQIERLCREYDIPTSDIIDRFKAEYAEYRRTEEHELRNRQSRSFASSRHGHADMGWKPKPVNMASVVIVVFVLLLVAFLAYAFYSYKTRKLPEHLNIDLTEHVPIHKPKVIYLDELQKRR